MAGLKAISVTHSTAPLEMREKLSLSLSDVTALGSVLREYLDIDDLMILSTCNRTEIYYRSNDILSRNILKIYSGFKRVDLEQFYVHFMFYSTTADTLDHLFRVAAGLESQILGDSQIINQLKASYNHSVEQGWCTGYLHHIVHQVFQCNKQITSETGLKAGANSLSYSVLKEMKKMHVEKDQPILLVGAGKINSEICKNLKSHGYGNVTLCNRTKRKADLLAQRFGFNSMSWSNLQQGVDSHDVIVSAVSTKTPVITKKMVSKTRSKALIMDLSVPRTVDGGVEELTGVDLLNIDQLNKAHAQTIESRKECIPQVLAIINDYLTGLEGWERERLIGPIVSDLKSQFEKYVSEEVSRRSNKSDEADLLLAEEIARSVVQKIIKVPTVNLRKGCAEGADTNSQLVLLRSLFLHSMSTRVK